jgi:hypothetical protein
MTENRMEILTTDRVNEFSDNEVQKIWARSLLWGIDEEDM